MGMFSRVSDEDLLTQLVARGRKPGHQSKEDKELATELLNRPHLIFAGLHEAARGGQVQKSLMVIRDSFPCLSKDEQEKAIRDIARRGWVVTNDKLAITRFVKTVREATVEVNEERVSQMILSSLCQNPLMVELGARHRAELEAITTRHGRELQELVFAIVSKAIKQQMG